MLFSCWFRFFFHATATTEIYTLSLHDALPICVLSDMAILSLVGAQMKDMVGVAGKMFSTLGDHNVNLEMISQGKNLDRKSTRLNSSHSQISYAVFCLKKKKKTRKLRRVQTRPQ